MGIRFEWDPAKAAHNQRKHGISFELAVQVFGDPFAIFEQDRIESNEYRWQTLGRAGGRVLLVVAHSWIDFDDSLEIIRVISARPMTRLERRRYEKQCG